MNNITIKVGIFGILGLSWAVIFCYAVDIQLINFSQSDSILQKTTPINHKPIISSLNLQDSLDSIKTVELKQNLTWSTFMRKHSIPRDFRIFISKNFLKHELPFGSRIFIKKSSFYHEILKTICVYYPNGKVDLFKKDHSNQWVHQSKYTTSIKEYFFSGIVNTTLWDSAQTEKMDPEILSQLSEVFSSQIDLNRETKKGDEWRLSIEGIRAGDEIIGWQPIKAAQLKINSQTYSAVRFSAPGFHQSYFDLHGKNIQKNYLASPIRYSRINSGFLHRRFHPIEGRFKPHLGIDYGAAYGTPVLAISAGEITYLGHNYISGNMIKISHGPDRESRYLHLSHFSKRLKKGSRVYTGQVIGFVGDSGLATGPHLHFEFWLDGKVIDPSGEELARARILPPKYRPLFKKESSRIIASLPNWKRSGTSTVFSTQIASFPSL